MIHLKKINKSDYEKAIENTHLQELPSENYMIIKKEFQGCLFVYDDEFEKKYNEIDGVDDLEVWLHTRGYHNS
jgi:hypothetical protein